MQNTQSAIFRVKFGERFIGPCDSSVIEWLTKNNKNRLKSDLPKDTFIAGFEINGTFYPLPSYMHKEWYVLRSAKMGIGSRLFKCCWVFGQIGEENESSDHAPLEEDLEAYEALSEEVRAEHLWWIDYESAGTGLLEALSNIIDDHGLDESNVDETELVEQVIVNACNC